MLLIPPSMQWDDALFVVRILGQQQNLQSRFQGLALFAQQRQLSLRQLAEIRIRSFEQRFVLFDLGAEVPPLAVGTYDPFEV